MENKTYEYWCKLKAKRQEEQQQRNRENYIFNHCMDKCVRFLRQCNGGGQKCWKRQKFSDY